MSRYKMFTILLILSPILVKAQGTLFESKPKTLIDGEAGLISCTIQTDEDLIGFGIYRDGILWEQYCTLPGSGCVLPSPEETEIDRMERSQYYTLDRNSTTITVGIPSVSKQRDGRIWTCLVYTFSSPEIKIRKRFNIKVPVTGVIIADKDKLNFTEGVSVTMTCILTNTPDPLVSYRWFIMKTNQTLSNSPTFKFTPLKTYHGQNLACSAFNGYGSVQTDRVLIFLPVPVKGVMIEDKGNLDFTEGVSTTMNCNVTNQPDPQAFYRWFIMETDQTLSNSPTFQFTPLKTYDGQNLACLATNFYGSAHTDKVLLNVQHSQAQDSGHMMVFYDGV